MLKIKNEKNIKLSLLQYTGITYLQKKNKINVNTTEVIDLNYTGKTYKWRIRKNLLKLTFNRAHKTWIFLKKCNLKIIAKNKTSLFVCDKKTKNNLCGILQKVRKNNIFTQRGIKIKNRLVYKKRGKISTYK